jgi:hypothetical protein
VTPAARSDHRIVAADGHGFRLWIPGLAALVATKIFLHVPGLFRYGYFRDELYFLDCGRHLAWGYVDHAPLVGLYAKVVLLLGGSLPAVRAFPLVAGSALVALTMVLARALGGGRFAQAMAGLAVVVAPVNLMVASILSMNVVEPLVWTGGALLIARIIRTADSRLWVWFGLLVGIGLLNKHSTLVFGLAVAAAVLATPLRRELKRPWIWLGAVTAFVVFAPNLAWQVHNGFPTLEDLRNVRESGKNVILAPIPFLAQQVMMIHPVLAPVWVAGLWHLLVGRGRRFRPLGIIYLVLLGLFMALHGKDYYLAPAYPVLFAAGSAALEGWLARTSCLAGRLWPQAAAFALIVSGGVVTAPLALPILSPEHHVSYRQALGVAPSKTEVAHEGPLPQLWGDQFGWPELVAEVARIYDALPAAERAEACVFAGNYGEAGAINLFGPRYGLPRAISAHQNHFFWGPPTDCPGRVMIVLQSDREDLERLFASVAEAGHHFHPWGMAEENGPIWVARGLKVPLVDLWPTLKHWN